MMPEMLTGNYNLHHLIEFTGVRPMRVKRWVDAGIIKAAGGGGSPGKRREYSFDNLIQIKACGEMADLGMSELGMRQALIALAGHWTEQVFSYQPKDGGAVLYLQLGRIRRELYLRLQGLKSSAALPSSPVLSVPPELWKKAMSEIPFDETWARNLISRTNLK